MHGSALCAEIFGARGSLPNPSAATVRYGGATTCLGIETPDDIPIVIDGGSGIFELGAQLKTREQKELHMFFTHTHWDHVQGLPFFAPLYDANWQVHIYSLGERRASVREIFSGVYKERYFPVPFERLAASIQFHELAFEDEVVVGNTHIRCRRVNHPGFALGFRIDHGGRSLFFAGDSAPYTEMLFEDKFHIREKEQRPEVLEEMRRLATRLRDFVDGVELMFHDANYTDGEYEKLFHFGHASIRQACDLALTCHAGRLVLWHHDRARSDAEVETICKEQIERAANEGLTVEPATQGARYQLPIGTDQILCSLVCDSQ